MVKNVNCKPTYRLFCFIFNYVNVHVHAVCGGAGGGLKEVVDPLELEL